MSYQKPPTWRTYQSLSKNWKWCPKKFLSTTPSANLHWSIFLWHQSDSNKKAKYVPKSVRRKRHKKVAPLPSTRINELLASDQNVNEREQSLIVWLNNEMEGSYLLQNYLWRQHGREPRQNQCPFPPGLTVNAVHEPWLRRGGYTLSCV